jgi:hypothetical protein
MPQELQSWRWRTMSLVTFSSPAVGNEKFRKSLDRIRPGKRIWVDGDPITKEMPTRCYAVGINQELKNRKDVLANTEANKKTLNPHEPLAVRRSLCADLEEDSSLETVHIPMTAINNEPWKLRRSGMAVLETLALGRKPKELAALIPNCEEFLLLLLRNLQSYYDTALNTEVTKIADQIEKLNTGQRDASTKLKSLCKTWNSCDGLKGKKGSSLHNLIGLCMFFNAVSTDGNVYVNRDQFDVDV